MKLKQFFAILLVATIAITSCSDDERSTDFVNNVAPPSDLAIQTVVSTDNSGDVTIVPSGTSVASFVIDYGDGSDISEDIVSGNSVIHTYPEGTYMITAVAKNSTGETAITTTEVTVAFEFAAPANLEVDITATVGNVFEITVDPSADNVTGFNVFFGDVANEVATPVAVNGEATHLYPGAGTFDITVEAFNPVGEMISLTETIIIENPDLFLPLNFEDTAIDYGIIGFEGADSMIAANPDASGINTSNTVVETIKTVGAQFFAGTIIELEAPINFSTQQKVAIKVYSPKANIPVRLKLESAAGGSEFVELDVNTTVVNQWEELVWDFTGEPNLELDLVKVVVFFEFVDGLAGDGSTYYFDDVELVD